MSEPILSIRNLKQYFPIGKRNGQNIYVKAVDDVSLDIMPGEVVGLVGESGSGKSTIAYSVIGMYEPTDGQIFFQGQPLNDKGKKRPLAMKKDMQIVFQDPGSSLNAHQTIKEILELPLKVHGMCMTRAEREQRVRELLTMVELPENYLFKSPNSIGGGEKQMVAIARALATEPKFIILDEPTSALDVSIQAKIINMLLKLQKERNMTYLFITHDLSLMRNIATKVGILYLGRLSEVAHTEAFFRKPEHPYTQMLISSIPVVSEEEEKLKPSRVESRGEIPSPVNIPPGCSFHTRCPSATERCRIDDPVMHNIENAHRVRCHLFSG
jgi:peptide/nickel transport system ATP-binding protein